ncbi:MAG TPA: glycosyltransferase [Methylomirabilota bacterium]
MVSSPAPSIRSQSPPDVELSVVIPCLNEADTVATCVGKAMRAMREAGIKGEVIVADNGSTDGSQSLAEAAGARVVPVPTKGYGSALRGGIAAAGGRYVIMGDADDSYDFGEIPRILAKLRDGYDLVQGCRLPSGGGTVMPGAMPASHRWLGNPFFSLLGRWWFGVPVHDVNCGLRGFTMAHYRSLDQRCTGMEFAVEMLVKSSLLGARITEVPITLHRDGRVSRTPHLRTWRDGWRTLRFILAYSPRWLFFLPGMILILLGLFGYAVAFPRLTIRGTTFDVHTLLFASLAVLLGHQSILFALYTKTFAISEGLLPADPRMTRMATIFPLERGLLLGGVVFGTGIVLLAGAVNIWRAAGFGPLDYDYTMRWVIPGATLTALGFQTILGSFFLSILRLRRT